MEINKEDFIENGINISGVKLLKKGVIPDELSSRQALVFLQPGTVYEVLGIVEVDERKNEKTGQTFKKHWAVGLRTKGANGVERDLTVSLTVLQGTSFLYNFDQKKWETKSLDKPFFLDIKDVDAYIGKKFKTSNEPVMLETQKFDGNGDPINETTAKPFFHFAVAK